MPKKQPEENQKEIKAFLARLDSELWRKASINRIDTGEGVNALINRLLAEYFSGKD